MSRNRKATKHDGNKIELEVHFPEGVAISATDIAHLAVEFLNSLLLQRKQIPVSIRTLKQDVAKGGERNKMLEEKELEYLKLPAGTEETETTTRITDSEYRQVNKVKKQQLRSARLQAKYLNRAELFLQQYQQLVDCIQEAILRSLSHSKYSGRIRSICYVFGASPACPKEIYCLDLSDYSRPTNQVNRRIAMQLFRTLASHEQIFSWLGQNFVRTNLYVAILTDSSISCHKDVSFDSPDDNIACPGLSVRSEFQFPPANQRCKLGVFKIVSCDIDSVFSNDIIHNGLDSCTRPGIAGTTNNVISETPARKARTLSGTGSTSMTPQPMVMCTPMPSNRGTTDCCRDKHCFAKTSECYDYHNMVETPCAATSTTRKIKKHKMRQGSGALGKFDESPSHNEYIGSGENISSEAVQQTLKCVPFDVSEHVKNVNSESAAAAVDESHLDNFRVNNDAIQQWLFFENMLKGFLDPRK